MPKPKPVLISDSENHCQHRLTRDESFTDDLVYAVWSGNVVIGRFRTEGAARDFLDCCVSEVSQEVTP